MNSGNEEINVDLLECDFDLDTDFGRQSFFDYNIYKVSPNIGCITEDFIQSNRYKKLEKKEFLQSMLESEIGLFEITAVNSKEGYAYIKEVFTGKTYEIIDIGMSGQQNYNKIYIYTRIITYRGISFGSGLNFIFEKTNPFINKHIKSHKKDYKPLGGFARFIEIYNYLHKNPEKNKAITITI